MAEPTPPTVSAIVTTYNYAAYIADALDSVLAQTRLPDEILVIDDGSTDETAEIVASYASHGVRYIRQENSGAGAARNRGLRESRGELIAFLDADDMWMTDKLERQLAEMRSQPACVLVSGQMLWWHVRKDEHHIERFGIQPHRNLRREIAVRNVVGNPSMALMRRSAIEQVGPFDETLRWGQDWELFIRLARAGEFIWLNDPVITYRWHGASLSHGNRWQRLETLERIGRRAVGSHTSAWQRALLWERVWSTHEMERARLLARDDGPRRERARRALLAFAAWPFDEPQVKAEFAVRSLVGESVFQRLRGLKSRH